MRKLFCALLAVFLLTGCSKPEQPKATTTPTTAPTQTTAPAPDGPEVPAPVKSAEIEVLSCTFKEQILPTDFETYMGWFPAEEGKMYVDLTLRVENTGELPLGKEDLSAYFEYEEKRYDLQLEVEENAWNFANEDRTIPLGQARTVHLFYNVDREAVNTPLTVYYTLLDQTGEIPVGPEAEPVLEDKILLQLSDTVSWGETGTVQVMDCLVRPYLRPTGNGAEKFYSPSGDDMFILVLKVDSESELTPNLLDAYLMAGQIPEFAQIYVESEDHLSFIPLEEAPEPQAGEERIYHLWVEIPFGMPTEGMSIRLNVDTVSYYCCPFG